jgi:hypothetical protein
VHGEWRRTELWVRERTDGNGFVWGYVYVYVRKKYKLSSEIMSVNISLKYYYNYQNKIHPCLTFNG